MNFLAATHTDVGIKKKTNQDSLLVQQARTEYGNVLLAVVCDGMGGLSKGEVASAGVIHAFSDWFQNEFPSILYDGMQPATLRTSWEQLVTNANIRISEYAERSMVNMGTTCVAFLAINDVYYILNVGDSRVYLISDNIYQLTKDQTYVQREMDANRMTYEQAMRDPQRNVLLQCIGASDYVQPDFFTGMLTENQCFLLCSDGFRHVINPDELYQALMPAVATEVQTMKTNLMQLTELNKQRMETDNISAILIRTY